MEPVESIERTQVGGTIPSLSDHNLSQGASKLVSCAIEEAVHGLEGCDTSAKQRVKSENMSPENENSVSNLRATPSTNQFQLNEVTEEQSGNAIVPAYISVTPSDSTQVLVPISAIPEESSFRIGPTASFVQKHTFPVESEMGTGTLHRNPASFELDVIQVESIAQRLEKVAAGDIVKGGVSPDQADAEHRESSERLENEGTVEVIDHGSIGVNKDFETLMDEMASNVGRISIDKTHSQKAYLLEVYKKVSEVANATAKITRDSKSTNSLKSSSPDANFVASAIQIPPEVKEHILRTLTGVMAQLDAVKKQLLMSRQ